MFNGWAHGKIGGWKICHCKKGECYYDPEPTFHRDTLGMTVGEAYALAHKLWDDETISEVNDPNIQYLYWH